METNPRAGRHTKLCVSARRMSGWEMIGHYVVSHSELELLEDEELVVRTREGDERALETLIARYRHFARSKGRSFFLAGSDREDVVQEGMIGLFKAIRDFDVEQGVPFIPFAELCISRQILSAIKSANRYKHHPLNSSLSLDAPIYSSLGEERSVAELLVAGDETDPAELVVSAEEIEAIRDSMKQHLTELEGRVLNLYIDGKSYEQIAGLLGNHVKSIDNALQRIKRKLHRHLSQRVQS
jgi:RNA polymerase sporulation-specific sigma factor